MILSEVRNFIQQAGKVNILQLTKTFNVEINAMRGMLAHWIRKGVIRACSQEGCQSGCAMCGVADIESYEICR